MGKKLKKKQQNSQIPGKEQRDRAFFDEAYIKRAEAMEKELFWDEDPEDGEESSDEEEAASYEKLIQRLKTEGIYQEDAKPYAAEKQKSRSSLSGEISRSRIIRRCLSRAAVIILLCSACIFTVSMTSEANRNYLVEKMQYMMGNDTKIIAGNDIENDNINYTEQDAVREIETALDVEVPEFYYRPERFEFYKHNIDVSTDIAQIEYEYDGNIICCIIDKQEDSTASRNSSVNGKKNNFIVTSPEGIQVTVEEHKEEKDILPSYTAIWERDNVVYWLVGRMEKQEIINIFEDMVY